MFRLFLVLLAAASPCFADKASFIQLCESSVLSADTTQTLDALRKHVEWNALLQGKERSSEKATCSELGESLSKVEKLVLPGGTFAYFFTPDLTPIAHLSWLKSLNISGQTVHSLEPLRFLKQLHTLRISGVRAQAQGLAVLTELPALQSLQVTLNSGEDADTVADLKAIKDLTLFVGNLTLKNLPYTVQTLELHASPETKVELSSGNFRSMSVNGLVARDLEWLTASKHWLTELRLHGTQIQDYSALGEMRALRKVEVEDSNLTDLGFMKELLYVEELELARNQIHDVGPLSGLTRLRTLTLDSNPLWNVGSQLGTLFKLEKLSMRDARQVGVLKLEYLERLRILDLTGNHYHTMVIPNQADAHYRLEELYMGNNEVRWIDKGLENLKNLKVLVLSSNKLTSVKELEVLTTLETLSLEDNKLTDVSGLSALTSLKQLRLRDNPLSSKDCPVFPASICQ